MSANIIDFVRAHPDPLVTEASRLKWVNSALLEASRCREERKFALAAIMLRAAAALLDTLDRPEPPKGAA